MFKGVLSLKLLFDGGGWGCWKREREVVRLGKKERKREGGHGRREVGRGGNRQRERQTKT